MNNLEKSKSSTRLTKRKKNEKKTKSKNLTKGAVLLDKFFLEKGARGDSSEEIRANTAQKPERLKGEDLKRPILEKMSLTSCKIETCNASHYLKQGMREEEERKFLDKNWCSKMAFEMYKKAAEEGDAEASFLVARCYARGKGVRKKREMALRYYAEAAEKGHPRANFFLALHFFFSNSNRDECKAISLFKKAACLGHPPALYMLHLLYEEGTEVKKDEKRAFEWLKRAADKGHKKAAEKMGRIYREGVGVEKDLEKAAFYFFKFAGKRGRLLAEVVDSRMVKWRPEYHRYWLKEEERAKRRLDSKIITILLISRSRNLSKAPSVNFLVKGVAMKVIEFLSHFSQPPKKKKYSLVDSDSEELLSVDSSDTLED